MAIDVEALLTPISEDNPAGPERLDSAERALIERYFNDAIDTQTSDGKKVTNREASAEPEAVQAAILAEFDQTLDLALGVALAQIGARLGDLDAAAAGIEVTAGLLERYWDSVHPTLEIAEIIGRRNLCNTLGAYPEFIRPLREATVLRHPRLPAVTLGQLADLVDADDAGDRAMINAIIYGDTERNLSGLGPEAPKAALADLTRVEGALGRIEAVLAAQGGAPNYDRVRGVTAAAAAGLRTFLTETSEAPPPAEGEAASSAEPVARGGGAPGRIESREDVVKALDAICAYYERKEPGSPVPLALRRARGWVFMSFIDVLRDIAPGSMDDATRVLGGKPD
jgi:type VI secretion system ImpA family protein